MNEYYPCSQLLGPLCCFSNGSSREVGKFNTGDGDDVPILSGYETILANLVEYSFQGSQANVVG